MLMLWGSAEVSFEGLVESIWLLAFRSRVAREMVEINVVKARSLSFWCERPMLLEVGFGLDILVSFTVLMKLG